MSRSGQKSQKNPISARFQRLRPRIGKVIMLWRYRSGGSGFDDTAAFGLEASL